MLKTNIYIMFIITNFIYERCEQRTSEPES